MRHSRITSLWIVAAAGLLLQCGCGGGSASVRVNNGHGTVIIHLTDAPLNLSDVRSLNVTLTGVLVYPAEELGPGVTDPARMELQPTVVMSHPATFDLLTLNGGATELLASGPVPEGGFEKIRLEISEAQLVGKDGRVSSLEIGSRSVDVPFSFQVVENGEIAITLDFDAGASVQVSPPGSGRMVLIPVVTPVSR